MGAFQHYQFRCTRLGYYSSTKVLLYGALPSPPSRCERERSWEGEGGAREGAPYLLLCAACSCASPLRLSPATRRSLCSGGSSLDSVGGSNRTEALISRFSRQRTQYVKTREEKKMASLQPHRRPLVGKFRCLQVLYRAYSA